jgi:hypothetical protein
MMIITILLYESRAATVVVHGIRFFVFMYNARIECVLNLEPTYSINVGENAYPCELFLNILNCSIIMPLCNQSYIYNCSSCYISISFEAYI